MAIGLALAVTVSSLTTISVSSHVFAPKLRRHASLSPPSFSYSSSPCPYDSIASDLLDLLGTPQDASRVHEPEARELLSCLRFLVPFKPISKSFGRVAIDSDDQRRELFAARGSGARANELVWWPPDSVMELARLAVDSGGDPAEITRALDLAMLIVPDVEGCKEDGCELTRTPYGRRFADKVLNSYLEFLFELIVLRCPLAGFNVTLSRYDLFHGHIFLASGSGRLAILFHAKEYPAYEKEDFPYNLGYCQKGSNVNYDDSINLRNILWLAPLPSNTSKAWLAPGVLVALDAHPDGIIYKKLVPEYVDAVRTIYEEDFGDVVADVNYLNVKGLAPSDNIFIC